MMPSGLFLFRRNVLSQIAPVSIAFLLLFLFFSCKRNGSPEPSAYHDSLMVCHKRASNQLEAALRSLPENPIGKNSDTFKKAITEERKKVEDWGAFNEDSSLVTAVDSCLSSYERLHQTQLPEIRKLLHKPRLSFSKADEARLEFLYREVELLTDRGFKQVLNSSRVFSGKHGLKPPQNIPLQP